MKTEKQINAWLKVKLKNLNHMVDKRTARENKDRLFDLYSKLVDLIHG